MLFGKLQVLVILTLLVLLTSNPIFASRLLIERSSCGKKFIRQASSFTVAPLNEIPPGEFRRYAGMIGLPLGVDQTPVYYITPYLSAHAHASLIKVIAAKHGLRDPKDDKDKFVSLWSGELEYENISSDRSAPKIRFRKGTETSGEYARWAMRQRGEIPDRESHLPTNVQHLNSVEWLEGIHKNYLAHMLDDKSVFTDWKQTNPLAPHIDEDLNGLVGYFRQEFIRAGHPEHPVNVCHDILTPMNNIILNTGFIIPSAELPIPVAQRPAMRAYGVEVIIRNRPPVLTYLKILKKQYPEDVLLQKAITTLEEMGTFPNEEFDGEKRLSRIANLKEVLEFIGTIDLAGVTQIPLIIGAK